MFGNDKSTKSDTERSLIGEAVTIDGNINSAGSIDVAGLIKGPVISKEIIVKDTGSIVGEVEADKVEVLGHINGKISAKNIVIRSTGTVKGDLLFAENLLTENGADIDGYIKKTNETKSIIGETIFKKKKSDNVKKPQILNKTASA